MILVALVLLALVVFALHTRAYGYCKNCQEHREPKCKCDEQNKLIRKPKYRL